MLVLRRPFFRLSAVGLSIVMLLALGGPVSAAEHDTWTSVASMPGSHGFSAAATAPDGTVYVLDGDDTLAYTPSTNSWAAAASMPTPRAALAAATGSDGRIYAIGGHQGPSVVEAYSPSTDTWSAVAPLPTPVAFAAATTGLDGRIYVLGGLTTASFTNAVQVYTPSTDTWTDVARMPSARATGAAATGSDGRIYVFGGFESIGADASVSVHAYDPSRDVWTFVPPLPTARAFLVGAAGLGGNQIFAIGGLGFGGGNAYPVADVQAYSPAFGTWVGVRPMSTPRWGGAAATGTDGLIYAIGGASLATVEALTYDHTPPVSEFGTSTGSVLISLPPLVQDLVTGTVTDEGGSSLKDVDVTFSPATVGAPATMKADVRCDAVCEWSVAPPFQPGAYTVTVRGTDRAGNPELSGPTPITIVVV